MTKVVLKATEKTADSLYGMNKVIITDSDYHLCNLFHKLKHMFISPETGTIEILKDNKRGTPLIIKLNESYKDKPLQYVEVYFNKHDSTNEYPLILVLIFNDESKKVPNKYYRLSNITGETGSSQDISSLKDYNEPNDILKPLVEVNDNTKSLLTFQLDIRDTETYNGDKIKLIKEEVQGENGDTSHEFTKYKHEPKNRHNIKAWNYLFRMNLLVGRTNNSPKPIVELQGQKYIVTSYWSVRVDIPLLLEFNQSKQVGETNMNYFEFYITRNDKDGIYFEKLGQETKEMKELLKDSSYDIYTTLTKDKNKLLINLLKKLKTNLIEVLFIMIDKQDGYSKAGIAKSFKDLSQYRLANSDTNISVEDLTEVNDKCLTYLGFKVIQHYFINTVDSAKLSKDIVQFKFIIPKEYNDDYGKLNLYNTSKGVEREDILYCNPSHSKLFIYFFGEDPRPLLLRYGSNSYGPKDKANYFTKWYKYENINNTVCIDGSADNQLLKALYDIVGFLNTVELDKKPSTSHQNISPKISGKSETYVLQWFKLKNIGINLSYKNETCYRIYTHAPNGTDGNGNGFRLGKVLYGTQNSQDNGLNNSLSKHLSKVSVLYNVYDHQHQYPLLVVLKFGSQEIEYYRLTSKENPYKWEKIDSSGLVNIEELAQSIKNELQVEFTDEEKKRYLFNPKDCEDTSSAAIAGTLSTLGLTAVGTGFAYYRYPEVFESLYRRLMRLIPMRLKW